MTNTTNEAAKNVAFELFERRLREQELVLSALEGHVEAAKAAKAKGEGVKNVRDRLNRMIAAGTGADEAFDEAFDEDVFKNYLDVLKGITYMRDLVAQSASADRAEGDRQAAIAQGIADDEFALPEMRERAGKLATEWKLVAPARGRGGRPAGSGAGSAGPLGFTVRVWDRELGKEVGSATAGPPNSLGWTISGKPGSNEERNHGVRKTQADNPALWDAITKVMRSEAKVADDGSHYVVTRSDAPLTSEPKVEATDEATAA